MQPRSYPDKDQRLDQAQSHIEALKCRRSIVSDNTTTVANMISQQMHQLFHDPKCFIYEIIQNAEDAEADSISFHLDGDDLVISYNGKPFAEHDIERVCDASRDNDADMRAKSNQSDKIGYKGIGFKSVFGISSEIIILSPETQYFFCFSKSYWDAQITEHTHEGHTSLARFPWQIIPLWLEEEKYQSIAKSTENFENNVTIVLRNIDSAKIMPELMNFVILDERLVFLNRIRKIEFVHLTTTYHIEKQYTEALCRINRSQISVRAQIKYETLWHIHCATAPVEEDVTERLARLDLSSCPEKIKSAKNTEIIFAVKIKKSDTGEYVFLPPFDSKLYCYLPTSVECHLPFLVNARFILNQDRSAIINNAWNRFLLKSIAIQHLKWLGNLVCNPMHRNNILMLFTLKNGYEIFPQLRRKIFQEGLEEESSQENLLGAYQEGMIEAKRRVAFIPSKEQDLLCVSECIIDTTQFFKDIDERILDSTMLVNARSKLVSYDLRDRELLINTSLEYSFHQLLEGIERYFKALGDSAAHVDLRSKMIMFILSSDKMLAFFEKKILLSIHRRFCSPNDSFVITAKSGFTPESLAIFQINIADLSLYNQECSKKLSKAVDRVTEVMLIQKQIKKMILLDIIDENNSVYILRFIYSSCLSERTLFEILAKSGQEKDGISHFKVITRDSQIRRLNHCFLPMNKEDEKNFVNHQLSPSYFAENDDYAIWKKLLSCAKIKTSTELMVKSISYAQLEQYFKNTSQRGDLILEYTKHVLDQVPNSTIPPVVRKEFKERLIFSNFIYFPFMFDLGDSNTLNLFLNKLNASHSVFSQQPTITGTKHGGQIDSIDICEHFLTYYFRRTILVKVMGKSEFRLAGELFYLPELLENFDPDKLPVELAELPFKPNLAVAAFLGLRLSITLAEGLKLLSSVNKQIFRKKRLDIDDFNRLKAIYQLIVKIDLTREDVSIVAPWKEKHTLLSQAQTFEPSGSLKIFDQDSGEGLTCPDTAQWLHDVGLSNDQLKILSKTLNISCYSEDDNFRVTVSSYLSEITSAEQLKEFVLSILAATILIEHKEYGVSMHETHIKIFNEIQALTFQYCSDITFSNGYKPMNFARISGDFLYFTGRFMSAKVGELLCAKFQSKRAQEWFKEIIRLFSSQHKEHSLIKQKIEDVAKHNQETYNQMAFYQESRMAHFLSDPREDADASSAKTDQPAAVPEEKIAKALSTSPVIGNQNAATKLETPDRKRLSGLHGQALDFDPENSPVTSNPRHITQERHLRPLGNTEDGVRSFTKMKPLGASGVDGEDMAETEALNKRIGDRGEEIVFRKIVHLLQTQWGVEPVEVIVRDQESGRDSSAYRFTNPAGIQLDVIWYNKDRGSQQVMESPVDIVIAVNDKEKYFIEVKSTAFASKSTFFLTTNEWEYMQNKREKSILVRAYEVEKAIARFEVYKDPFGMICNNLITFMTGGEFRLKIKSPEEARGHIFEEDTELGCKIS